MARLKVLPCALYDSSTGFSAAALTGCFGLPSSNGTVFFISAHTAFDTVMAAPLDDSVNGVTISLFCVLGSLGLAWLIRRETRRSPTRRTA